MALEVVSEYKDVSECIVQPCEGAHGLIVLDTSRSQLHVVDTTGL